MCGMLNREKSSPYKKSVRKDRCGRKKNYSMMWPEFVSSYRNNEDEIINFKS